MQQHNTHQSLERALDILMAFTPDNLELGATEVSEKIGGMHRSTVTRLLQVLTRRGFLQQNPSTRKYSLGRSAAKIGRAVAQSLGSQLVNIAQPHVDALRDAIGEAAALEVFYQSNTILAYYAKGRHLVQVSFRIGDRLPVHVAAGAKAVLAFLPEDRAESLIPGKLERFTPHTITNRNELLKQLAEIRKKGVARDCGERDEDVHVIAAPVFNHENRPVAAVVISVPASRKKILTASKTIALLKDTTAAISSRLLN